MIELGALLLFGVAVVCLVLTAGLILKAVLWLVLLPVRLVFWTIGTLLLLPLLLIKLLAGGVIFLIAIARKVWRGDFDVERRGFFTSRKGYYEIVEIMGLYWHFVDLVWVFIFAFFYLW